MPDLPPDKVQEKMQEVLQLMAQNNHTQPIPIPPFQSGPLQQLNLNNMLQHGSPAPPAPSGGYNHFPRSSRMPMTQFNQNLIQKVIGKPDAAEVIELDKPEVE